MRSVVCDEALHHLHPSLAMYVSIPKVKLFPSRCRKITPFEGRELVGKLNQKIN